MLRVPIACVLLLAAAGIAASAPRYSDDKINVHADDVGWLKTVDQYYMGLNNSIQHAGVQYILDTVVPRLADKPDRKFIYVEQAFFQRWWRQQDESMRNLTRKVVAAGQLEFVNGGWCMHDEAATHYISMVDQTTVGHMMLKDEFGAVPRIGWQIDPFGHSSTQASLLSAEVGFDGLFFGRIDYQDRTERLKEQRMEFLWRASPSLGVDNQVFTGAFQSGNYGPPSGFCFDQFCSDPPIQDDPSLEDMNVQQRVDQFVNETLKFYSQNAPSNHIMYTFGSDFQYENADEWFKNLDKLMAAVNKDGRLNMFYSTPSQYVDAVHDQNMSWTVKTDDFFPYADNFDAYWTGYFTSRPAVKGFVRESSAFLQSARQVEVFATAAADDTALGPFEEDLGVVQHHDAVSGTEKQHVAYDYAKRLSKGMALAENLVTSAMADVTTPQGEAAPAFSTCRYLNESICSVSQTATKTMVLMQNPLPRNHSVAVRIPISTSAATVTNAAGKAVPAAIVKNTLPASSGSATHSVSFVAQLPPTGYTTYFVETHSSAPEMDAASATTVVAQQRLLRGNADTNVTNGIVQLTYGADGRLSAMTNVQAGVTVKVNQDWLWYNSSAHGTHWGSPADASQASGAYIFRPNGSSPLPITTGDVALSVQRTATATVVTQKWSDWMVQETRLWDSLPYVETEFLVGPIPIADGLGKEVITRFNTSIASDSLFYTDSNGRELLRREKNFRPTWKLNVTEPVAGNYYPVNAIATINDTKAQFTVLPDRSQGGSSLGDGSLEVMVHRRILYDDGRGVGEPLNETQGITPYPNPVRIGHGLIIRAKHRILLDTPANAAAGFRPMADDVFAKPLMLFADASSTTPAEWTASHIVEGQWIKEPLPVNVNLMTLRRWNTTTSLVRLSHQFAVDEDAKLSQPVTVDLASLCPAGTTITAIEERSLTTNQLKADVHRLVWKSVDGEVMKANNHVALVNTTVTLNPMQIRTFLVSTK